MTLHGVTNFFQTGDMLNDIITQLRVQDEAIALTTLLQDGN